MQWLVPPDCPLSVGELEALKLIAYGQAPRDRKIVWAARKRMGGISAPEAVRVLVQAGWLDWTPSHTRRTRKRKVKRKSRPERPIGITPTMRRYLQAFDHFLAGDPTARARMTTALEDMRREARHRSH